MKKIFITLFILLVLVIVIIGQVWVLSTQKGITEEKNTTSNRETKELLPTSTPTSYIPGDILYQTEDDKEGRTIIYKNQIYSYSEAGEFYNTTVSPKRLIYMIGTFEGWEEIKGSKDRYLLSNEPVGKKKLPKIRVAFEDSIFFNGGISDTVFGVENLTSGKVETKKRMLVKDIPDGKLSEILKVGDIVITYALFDEPKPKVQNLVYDEKGQLLASWLIVRRKEGLDSLSI